MTTEQDLRTLDQIAAVCRPKDADALRRIADYVRACEVQEPFAWQEQDGEILLSTDFVHPPKMGDISCVGFDPLYRKPYPPTSEEIAELRRQVLSYESMVSDRDERIAALEKQGPAVPDGWKLVPEQMCIDKDDINMLAYQAGVELTESQYEEATDLVLWVGQLDGDGDSPTVYGMHVGCAECMEEGSILLVEFEEPALADTQAPPASNLAVWFGSMPESNGRENWTAILYRKDDPKFDAHIDGFCFDRSEYKDRVRYAADRVRYVIGDLSEKPNILDYDSELHSGYMPPAIVAQIPATDAEKSTSAPFKNCAFQICDLPGQCVREGKCHHPRKLQIGQACGQTPDGMQFVPVELVEIIRRVSALHIERRVVLTVDMNNIAILLDQMDELESARDESALPAVDPVCEGGAE